MLDTPQEQSSIDLANNLSITISNTTNPIYIKSFDELIEPHPICILEEMGAIEGNELLPKYLATL